MIEISNVKIGTVANSSSTMHLLTTRELTRGDFSCEDSAGCIEPIIDSINYQIRIYNATKRPERKRKRFRTIKQMLPESYNQLRTIDTNYECLLSIYHQRKNHRLTEWKDFCDWILDLPYMKEFVGDTEND